MFAPCSPYADPMFILLLFWVIHHGAKLNHNLSSPCLAAVECNQWSHLRVHLGLLVGQEITWQESAPKSDSASKMRGNMVTGAV